MAQTAAHLVDHVLPHLPVRQWVLSVPKRLRYFMQRDGAALNSALRIFLRVVEQCLHRQCSGAAKLDKASVHIGAVAFIHRFGSSLNTHVHFHVCVSYGVFEALQGRPQRRPGNATGRCVSSCQQGADGARQGSRLEPDWGEAAQMAPDHARDQRP